MNKKYIAGIHNYCDRWCERCAFQHRCSVFAEEAMLSIDEKDINSEKFWERLSDNFKKTLEMLEKMAADLGLDFDEISEEAAADTARRDAAKEAGATAHDLEFEGVDPEKRRMFERIDRKTKRYSKQVDRFFDLNQDYFQGKQDDLETKIMMELPIDEAGLVNLKDAFEAIRWYQYFIAAKAHRSMSGHELEDTDEELYDPIQNDSNGSAKIALLAIRASMGSWEVVRRHFPEKTDELLDLFVLLRKTENELLAVFPKAMEFTRPGFDEPRRQPRKKKIDVKIYEPGRQN